MLCSTCNTCSLGFCVITTSVVGSTSFRMTPTLGSTSVSTTPGFTNPTSGATWGGSPVAVGMTAPLVIGLGAYSAMELPTPEVAPAAVETPWMGPTLIDSSSNNQTIRSLIAGGGAGGSAVWIKPFTGWG